MYKDLVYVEEQVAKEEHTLYILDKLKPKHIVYIKHYKDVFNQTGSNWRMQKQVQKLILAKRTNTFYYKGSNVTPDFGFEHFYYNTLALNCIYDCSYCYLQGLFTSPHLVLFVNNTDFIKETKTLIDTIKEPLYLALSYDTDLLALENWYPFCKEWINFCAQEENLTIEIRTKSNNINALQNCTPNNKVILAWTLSPQEIIEAHEPKTPNMMARIKAIKIAVDAGWRVRICIDPLLHVPNFENIYGAMINKLAELVSLEKIDSFSLGVFRMNTGFLKRIQLQRQDSALIYYPYIVENDTATYTTTIKDTLFNTIINQIKEKNKKAFITAL